MKAFRCVIAQHGGDAAVVAEVVAVLNSVAGIECRSVAAHETASATADVLIICWGSADLHSLALLVAQCRGRNLNRSVIIVGEFDDGRALNSLLKLGVADFVRLPLSSMELCSLSPEALVRTVLAARDRMPPVTIVAVTMAGRPDEIRDALMRARVAAAYGVTHLLSTGPGHLAGGGLRVLVPRELAYDGRDGQWRWRDEIPPRNRRFPMPDDEIDYLLDVGAPLPEWHTPPAVARELSRARRPRWHRGLVVFFTGLSGSGKSTIARGVSDALLEAGERTVTLLDGDVVRRELSAGLTFTKADRDLNVRRIAWVAAEAARHGGVALCCPIAPYAAARRGARELARAAGAGFVLVYVSTPIEVCEQRDRKGLYARARAGKIVGMTGVDDPYQEPTDADLVIDTSQTRLGDGVTTVLEYLASEGWIDVRGIRTGEPTPEAARP